MIAINPKAKEDDTENPYFNEEEKKEDHASDNKLNHIEIELEEIA